MKNFGLIRKKVSYFFNFSNEVFKGCHIGALLDILYPTNIKTYLKIYQIWFIFSQELFKARYQNLDMTVRYNFIGKMIFLNSGLGNSSAETEHR